jgi:hypothetical protein
MTNDLFLIAHKVRNEPAFDIACQMECPECNGHGDRNIADATFIACTECDSLGFWWIVPTSGHRAYPWYCIELRNLHIGFSKVSVTTVQVQDLDINSYPDHYHLTASPATIRSRLEDLLAHLPATPSKPFKRRF